METPEEREILCCGFGLSPQPQLFHGSAVAANIFFSEICEDPSSLAYQAEQSSP